MRRELAGSVQNRPIMRALVHMDGCCFMSQDRTHELCHDIEFYTVTGGVKGKEVMREARGDTIYPQSIGQWPKVWENISASLIGHSSSGSVSGRFQVGFNQSENDGDTYHVPTKSIELGAQFIRFVDLTDQPSR